MARARVLLKPGGPISLEIGSRKFEGSTAHVITDAAEILSFKANARFIVEDLDGEPTAPPKSDPKTSSKPPKGKAKPPKGKGKAAAEPEPEESEDEDDEEDDEEDVDALDEDALRAMTKKELAELAAERGIEGVDVQQNKDDMLARILTASKE